MSIKSGALAVLFAGIAAAQSQPQSQTFDFTNKPTMQGLQEVATILRTVGNIKQLSVDSAAETVTVSGTTDELAMSGWIIHALDQPAPPATTAPPQQYLVAGKSDDVVRVFHLHHVPADGPPQPIQEILTTLRTVADIQKIYNYTALADLVVRGPASQISFAQFVIDSLDVVPGSPFANREFDWQDAAQGTQQVKVIYLAHSPTPQSIQEILTVLRTVADIQKIFNYTPLSALVICAAPAQMAASEWLIQSLDIASAPKQNAQEFQMAGYGRVSPSVISVYYPANLTTPQGLNQTLTALRTNLQIQKTFDHSSPAALVVRGSADQISKAEQLMQMSDQAVKQP